MPSPPMTTTSLLYPHCRSELDSQLWYKIEMHNNKRRSVHMAQAESQSYENVVGKVAHRCSETSRDSLLHAISGDEASSRARTF